MRLPQNKPVEFHLNRKRFFLSFLRKYLTQNHLNEFQEVFPQFFVIAQSAGNFNHKAHQEVTKRTENKMILKLQLIETLLILSTKNQKN